MQKDFAAFGRIAKERQFDPDYSHSIPTGIRVTYIDPKGNYRYAQIDLESRLSLDDVRDLVRLVRKDSCAPLDQDIFDIE